MYTTDQGLAVDAANYRPFSPDSPGLPERLPKTGELWETKAGRLALIVAAPESVSSQHIAMLWWDDQEFEWTVSLIMDRLARPRNELSMSKFWEQG